MPGAVGWINRLICISDTSFFFFKGGLAAQAARDCEATKKVCAKRGLLMIYYIRHTLASQSYGIIMYVT